MEKITKYFTKSAEVVEDRVLRFIGSDEGKDRDNEQIKLSGWKIDQYKKNPIVLVNHQPLSLPVAKTKKVWVDSDKKALMFDIEFPEADVSPQGDSLFKLYKGGFMNAVSVGFMPNVEKITYGNTKKGEAYRIFNEQELMEISLVSIPSNPRALLSSKSVQKAVDEGVIDEVEFKDLQMWFEENFKNVETKSEKETPAETEKAEIPTNVATDVNNVLKCKVCEVEIECLCSKCKEDKDKQDFYKKLYESILLK